MEKAKRARKAETLKQTSLKPFLVRNVSFASISRSAHIAACAEQPTLGVGLAAPVAGEDRSSWAVAKVTGSFYGSTACSAGSEPSGPAKESGSGSVFCASRRLSTRLSRR
jgi:hypothetical protein